MKTALEKPIIVLGGGLSGLASALTLLEHGQKVVLIEKSSTLGGAASSILAPGNRKIPTGYHHIVGSDTELIASLKKLGILKKVKWNKAEVAVTVENKRISLSSPKDILFFKRLPLVSRFRYMFFGARCLIKKNWSNWQGKSVTEFIRSWADDKVLEEIFQPLVDIKFGFHTDEADAAWLGKRLTHREGAIPFGYIPNKSWPEELCNAFEKKILKLGGKIVKKTSVKNIKTLDDQAVSITTNKNTTIEAKAIINTLPPPVITEILKNSLAPKSWILLLSKIKYISCYSLILGLPKIPFNHYWTVALYPRRIFGGCFSISLLNNTLQTKQDQAVVNLFTNVPEGQYLWTLKEYQKNAVKDLQQIMGIKIKPNWTAVNIIQHVSPIFGKNYQNPPVKLGDNFYLAGIYTTYPKFSSTGEAIASGKKTALDLLENYEK